MTNFYQAHISIKQTLLSTAKLLVASCLLAVIISGAWYLKRTPTKIVFSNHQDVYTESHPIVTAAREQIGVVTKYDSSYYQGGYPPSDRGACTDVVALALKNVDYDLKTRIDHDMQQHPQRYPNEHDANINFRRVTNIRAYLDHHAQNLSTCTDQSCLNQDLWQAGDIVTFDQVPGRLWHIAIISNKYQINPKHPEVTIPYIIHNHGRGTVENMMLLTWPTPITGHYRLDL